MEMFSLKEITPAQMEPNGTSFRIHLKKKSKGEWRIESESLEIKLEQPDMCNIEEQDSKIFDDSDDEPIVLPTKTIICTDEEFVRSFGGIVESKIDLGEYELRI